jgi:CMP-N-acetylneuraminic acid synthetase
MNFDNCYFLIPARKGSKGFSFKNRKLFDYTATIIPEEFKSKVFVSTDDDFIKDRAHHYGFNVIDRPAALSTDTSSMKDVVAHFIQDKKIKKHNDIILLYLTYPERTWDDIMKIYRYFIDIKGSSLMCAEEITEHPYLCCHDKEEGCELLIEHSLYRRQDYPKCVKQSMFVACYKASIVNNLHDLLFEKNTILYRIVNKKIDIDYEKDYNKFNDTKRNHKEQ